MVGQRVNNFLILRMLGEGGMGAVYEALHPTLRKRVAIKVLRRELAFDAAVVQRFFNEARAASSIRHPNIIDIIDLGLLPDGVPYLMMELLEGESLAQLLAREGPLPIERAVDLGLQAARALEAAHRKGIVHRDLKPDNLFLIADPTNPGHQQIKVLDFGIAKLLGDLSAISVNTVAGQVFGTPPYMSPEQCRGQAGETDHRSDVYSLGIILYEMLCGKPPFSGGGLGDVMMMHLTTEPLAPGRLRPDLPPALEEVITTALAKRPAERFASMTELSAALTWGISQPAGDATQRDLAVPVAVAEAAAPRPPARRQLLLGGTAGAVLVLLLSAAAQLTADRAAPSATTLTQETRGPEVTVLPPRPSPPSPPAPPQVEPAPPAEPPREAPVRRTFGRRKLAAPAAADTTAVAPADATASTASATAAPAPPAPTAEPAVETAPAPVRNDAEPGFLSLDSAPWSNVSLEGKSLGSTPLIKVPLPPGRHSLTLNNPELGTSTTYVVEIQAGSVLSRFVGWDKE
jgi:serine/threonine-protein kinase